MTASARKLAVVLAVGATAFGCAAETSMPPSPGDSADEMGDPQKPPAAGPADIERFVYHRQGEGLPAGILVETPLHGDTVEASIQIKDELVKTWTLKPLAQGEVTLDVFTGKDGGVECPFTVHFDRESFVITASGDCPTSAPSPAGTYDKYGVRPEPVELVSQLAMLEAPSFQSCDERASNISELMDIWMSEADGHWLSCDAWLRCTIAFRVNGETKLEIFNIQIDETGTPDVSGAGCDRL